MSKLQKHQFRKMLGIKENEIEVSGQDWLLLAIMIILIILGVVL